MNGNRAMGISVKPRRAARVTVVAVTCAGALGLGTGQAFAYDFESSLACSEGNRSAAAEMAATGDFREVESIFIFPVGDAGDSETVQPPALGLRRSIQNSCVWAVINHSGDYSRVWIDRRRDGIHEGELGSRMVRSNNDGTYTAPFDAAGAEVRACGYTRVPVGMADDFKVSNDQGEVTNDIIDAEDGIRFSDVPKWLYKKLNRAGEALDLLRRYGTEPSHVSCTQWHVEPDRSEALAATR